MIHRAFVTNPPAHYFPAATIRADFLKRQKHEFSFLSPNCRPTHTLIPPRRRHLGDGADEVSNLCFNLTCWRRCHICEGQRLMLPAARIHCTNSNGELKP